jgi:hypothetical protein
MAFDASISASTVPSTNSPRSISSGAWDCADARAAVKKTIIGIHALAQSFFISHLPLSGCGVGRQKGRVA